MPETNNKSTLYKHEITFTDVQIGKDRNGRDYAKWRGTTTRRTGANAGKTVNISGMAFGTQFQELRSMIVVGATARFGGFHDRTPANAETNTPAMSTFVLFRHMPFTASNEVSVPAPVEAATNPTLAAFTSHMAA